MKSSSASSRSRHAVVATVRDDGAPVTSPCWYDVAPDGHIVLSMGERSHRLRHLRAEPRVALTVLGDSWYSHVSVLGRAVELRSDHDLADTGKMLVRLGDRIVQNDGRAFAEGLQRERQRQR